MVSFLSSILDPQSSILGFWHKEDPMLAAIIPVKALASAKSRLSKILSPAERRLLVQTMLGDVLAALLAAPSVARVGVISADPAVLAQARLAGAEPLADRSDGLNAALSQAAQHYTAAEALLVLPADVPLVTPAAIEQLVAAAERPRGAAIAPSRDGGTNALLLRPPLALPFHFGVGSLAEHTRAAREHSLPLRVATPPGLHLDVDHPEDLLLLAESDGATNTQLLLRDLCISERVMCV